MAPRLSVIIPVLNSHEVLRRQLIHYSQMPLPDGIEIILVDDGSDPPIKCVVEIWGRGLPIRLLETHDTRPWTWALARNAGAREANGEYLMMFDLDYIVLCGAFEDALAFDEDKMRFKREFGVLDAEGQFTQDFDVLRRYGLLEERIRNKGTRLPPHPNNFVMRKDLYWALGGYREDLVEKKYPQGEDRWFKRKWVEWANAGKVHDIDYRPTIYMFPNGQFCGDVDHNPFGLFHTLSRKTDENPWHKKILEERGHNKPPPSFRMPPPVPPISRS